MTAEFNIGAWWATNNSRKSYHRSKVAGSSESMWAPLVKVNHFLLRPGEMRDQFRAVSARLLVLPLASHEDGDLDLVDEGIRVQAGSRLRVVVRVGVDLGHQVAGLAVEGLVGRTGGVAVFDLLICPRLSAVRPGRLGVLLPLFGPGNCEAGVQDAPGIQRGRCRIDRRERRDGLEGRRIELRRRTAG